MNEITVYKQNKYLDFIDPILTDIERTYGIFSFIHADEPGKPNEIQNGKNDPFKTFPVNPIKESIYIFYKTDESNVLGSGMCGGGACVGINDFEDPSELFNLLHIDHNTNSAIIYNNTQTIRNRIIHELLHTCCINSDNLENETQAFLTRFERILYKLTKHIFKNHWEYQYYCYLRDKNLK